MTHWQDIILFSGSVVFSLALIPSVLSKDKPAFATSFSTGAILLIYAFTYITLSLYYAAISTTITGLLWLIMALQKYQQSHSRN